MTSGIFCFSERVQASLNLQAASPAGTQDAEGQAARTEQGEDERLLLSTKHGLVCPLTPGTHGMGGTSLSMSRPASVGHARVHRNIPEGPGFCWGQAVNGSKHVTLFFPCESLHV